ncbi:MAG: NYN domain-containing protein [Rhodospirillales bacterium]
MQTRIYVDGFNLYYGALKNTPHKWLDLNALCASVLPDNLHVDKIRYFTAMVSGATDFDAPRRQRIYLNALKTLPMVEIHYGKFLTKMVRRPLNNLPIGDCSILSTPRVTLPPGQYEIDNGARRQKLPVGAYPFSKNDQNSIGGDIQNTVIVEVHSSEEKGSDVNLASHLLNDAWHERFEAAAVISNDTDLIEPIRMVAQERNKPVYLISPRKRQAEGLVEAATYARHIRRNMLSACQFPDLIPGTTIRKPEEW